MGTATSHHPTEDDVEDEVFNKWVDQAEPVAPPPEGRREGTHPMTLVQDEQSIPLFDLCGLRKLPFNLMAPNLSLLMARAPMEKAALFVDQVTWGNVQHESWVQDQRKGFLEGLPRLLDAEVEEAKARIETLPASPFGVTALGNVAYIAIHAPTEELRAAYKATFDRAALLHIHYTETRAKAKA